MTDHEAVELLAKLHRDTRIPPPDLVGKLPKGGVQLDYLGHAAVTDLLLEHDPCWSWEPVAIDDQGRPLCDRDKEGWARGLWIRLTVHGHTRLGYGTCAGGKPDAVKELIGDALRNAAMRFGLALSLWAKEEWQTEGIETKTPAGGPDQRKTSGKEDPKEKVPRPGNTRSTKPAASSAAAGPVLRGDQAIAALAENLGLDDPTRIDVIRAVTDDAAHSGKDLNAEQITKTMRSLRWLADGFIQLQYDEHGTPSLVDTQPPNPGPPSR